MSSTQESVWGLLAEFADHEQLLAVRKARAEGYRRMDAYTPFPVEGLAEALAFRKTRMPLVTLIGGILGGLGGYGLQCWVNLSAYPLNIGGRPLHSWPAFIPVTFECTVLAAALFAVLGMLGLNGLPRPHHPLFNVEQFRRASVDGFFLAVFATDEKFDLDQTRQFLAGLEPVSVSEVPRY